MGRIIEVTQRQHDVVEQLLYDGADSATIALRLGIAPGTVRDHVKVILKNAGLPTRLALVVELLRGHSELKVVNGRDKLK